MKCRGINCGCFHGILGRKKRDIKWKSKNISFSKFESFFFLFCFAQVGGGGGGGNKKACLIIFYYYIFLFYSFSRDCYD